MLAENAGMESIVVCLNKTDLLPESGSASEMLAPYRRAGYTVLAVSAATGQGLESLRAYMTGKLSLFAGASGVGKSSLISRLTGTARETGNVSEKIGRGKHTTRHTEILPLPDVGSAAVFLPAGTEGMPPSGSAAGFCVDTPGFSQLDIEAIPKDRYAYLFREFRPYLGQCFFSDCRHLSENRCRVRAQVGEDIHPARYESYAQLMR
jgi:ribosome biogenesis GTPase